MHRLLDCKNWDIYIYKDWGGVCKLHRGHHGGMARLWHYCPLYRISSLCLLDIVEILLEHSFNFGNPTVSFSLLSYGIWVLSLLKWQENHGVFLSVNSILGCMNRPIYSENYFVRF
ncbi:hypothetical protein LOAG_05463 [Loa loa]|uniref:Uncharacterized protein n=1 Tax=Loa loa TaxID=7209 RepID=A0A1S0U061_LOALO|nr:hypothetical protein LOAG_05463 [Loa loa]EFO23025.1 hypothetical protein LOAG_05463 [Loa loa]